MKWNTFWTAVAAIAAVAAVWVGIKALQHEPKLRATVTFAPVEIAPEVQERLNACTKVGIDERDFLDGLVASLRAAWIESGSSSTQKRLRDMQNTVDEKMRTDRHQQPSPVIFPSHSMLHIHIVNNGNATANDARVTVPNASTIVVPGKHPESPEVTQGEDAALPNMAPTDEVNVVAFFNVAAAETAAEHIRLRHSAGTGEINVKGTDDPLETAEWICGSLFVLLIFLLVNAISRNLTAQNAVKALTNALAQAMPGQEAVIRKESEEWQKKRFKPT